MRLGGSSRKLRFGAAARASVMVAPGEGRPVFGLPHSDALFNDDALLARQIGQLHRSERVNSASAVGVACPGARSNGGSDGEQAGAE